MTTTFHAGRILQAQTLESAWDAWTTYTPTWSTSGTQPAIGNGTITGKYQQIGSTVHFMAGILMGGTTTYGTGQWNIGLPVNATQPGSPLDARFVGPVKSFDTSGGAHYHGQAVLGSASAVVIYGINSAIGLAAAVTATVPFTWASGDIITITGTYEGSY